MNWDFNSLFRCHAKEVTRFLRGRGLSEDTACDLTQDAFVRLLAAGPSTSPDSGNPRALLFQVARNLSIDLHRRARIVQHTHLDDEAFQAIADQQPLPDAIVFDRQRLAITAAALMELPERTRQALEWHRLDDRTIASIAQELGLSTTRTWSLIREAYGHIRQRLQDATQ